MSEVFDDGSNIVLKGDNYDLKIDSNRIIYVKKKNDTIYSSINHEIPYGYDRDSKKRFLIKLYEHMEARLQQEQQQEQ